jgi:DNA repair protein RecN (Recombination protein N)
VTASRRESVGARCYTCSVLKELRVENLLLIERAELELSEGLNVLTGETGAGKTVLAHALDLLLGGRARAGIVRPGAQEAYVEGVFELGGDLSERFLERLPECVEVSQDMVILARRVGVDGRTRAYVNGRSVTVGDMRDLAPALIAFYGQHEHRKLTLAGAQLEILDAFCGAEQQRHLDACAQAHAKVRELEEALAQRREVGESRERELQLLEHELAEIDQIAPEEAEYADLLARRERLKRLDSLCGAVGAAKDAYSGEGGDGPGAIEQLALAATRLEAVEGVDAQLDALSARQRELLLEAEDLASETRRYGETLTSESGDLDNVEERLSQLDRLIRKHGESIAAVLQHAEHARLRLDELQSAELKFNELTQALERARARRETHLKALRQARTRSAPVLAEAVRERLSTLAMPDVSFQITLHERAPGPSGADSVEFLIATNPGVQAGSLRDIASGGELSRVMLALMAVANSADSAPEQLTLVFDEVDAGIGGHTARTVGECLRGLAHSRQVLCITHLPQIASLASRHFSVVKDTSVSPTRTTVVQLDEAAVVSELVRMLGAGEQDAAARSHANELRRAA